jgi:hypothetical protein
VEVCGANSSNTIFYLALPTRTALKGGILDPTANKEHGVALKVRFALFEIKKPRIGKPLAALLVEDDGFYNAVVVLSAAPTAYRLPRVPL